MSPLGDFSDAFLETITIYDIRSIKCLPAFDLDNGAGL